MLKIESLQSAYGRSQVLFDVSLQIARGEVVSLIGRNGMGKTTTIRSVMGLLKPQGGQVSFDGRPIGGLRPDLVGRMGIGLVPEGRQVFPTLSVEENLVATAANRSRAASPWTLARVYELFPRLQERRRHGARQLSGGEQQMLAIGRALMTNPHLLILDEATEGLAPLIRSYIWKCLEALKAQGMAILVIDKNLAPLQRIADRHVVMEKGRTVWAGTSAELSASNEIVKQYLEP